MRKNKNEIGKYADVFTPVGVTGGLHLRYNDPMTKKYIYIHVQKTSVALKHTERCLKANNCEKAIVKV